MKILVVEDDLLVADALRETLSSRNYAVEIAHDGRSGLEAIEAFDYDLLLLDAILPNLDGVTLCKYVREQGYMMPIVLLTSKDGTHDRAIGLDAGADDYIVKPFDPEELTARIRALLRRGNDRSQPVLKWEALTLDPRNYEVSYHKQPLNLTPKEYALLELFLRHSRRLFSCGAILEHLWTYEDAPSEEAVRTHIKGLRQKLKAAGAPADLVETVYGIGYRLKEEPIAHRTDRLPQSEQSSQPDRPATARSSNLKPATVEDLPQFLVEIWHRHYPQMQERLASVERAIVAESEDRLSEEIRHEAWQAAHTLAGAVGTFGLTLGSQTAKQIEALLDANTASNPVGVASGNEHRLVQLQSKLALLRQEIESNAPIEPLPANPSPIGPWLLVISADRYFTDTLRAATNAYALVISSTPLDRWERPPAAIVLDFNGADGLAVLSQLTQDCPQIPLVAIGQPQAEGLDGQAWLRQRIDIAQRGARLCLSKSMPAEQMLLAIERIVQQVRASQPRVTIVDDDPALLEGVSDLLSLRGMTVTALSDPGRFWQTLEESQPDLLILDLDMPTHDGIELCRAVRTDPLWATLPILFLTAHSAAYASDRVFAAGADDFITKPVVDSTLVTRIVNRLDRIRLQRNAH